jgi:hypothetical protein
MRKLDNQVRRMRKPIRKHRSPAPKGVSLNPWGGPSLDVIVDMATKDMSPEEKAGWHFTTDVNDPLKSAVKDSQGYKPLMQGGQQVKYGGDLVWMLPNKEYKARIRSIGLESVQKLESARRSSSDEPPVTDAEGETHGIYESDNTEE